MSRRDRNAGWRLPEDLLRKIDAFADQTRRTKTGAAEVLLRRALVEAEHTREYVPPETEGDNP